MPSSILRKAVACYSSLTALVSTIMPQCYLHTHDVDELALRNDALDHSHASAVHHLVSAHFRALDHLMHNPQGDTPASLLHLEFLPAGTQAK